MASPRAQPTAPAHAIIQALGNAFKKEGQPSSGEEIAKLLFQNMGQLQQMAKEGKLNQQQIQQVCVRPYLEDHALMLLCTA